ncbi:MAG: hypothetical protein OXB88_05820 [Bacteriovoracales bacterium]|nr:hypothetical protein [Bacteriovoracales bacterium]
MGKRKCERCVKFSDRIHGVAVLTVLTLLGATLSCVPEGGLRSHQVNTTEPDIKTHPPDDGGPSPAPPKIKLHHIVDPYDGGHGPKATIPKSFSGILLIAGFNLARIKEEGGIWVRFRFGRSMSSFELPAWVGPSPIPGLTKTTFIDVLRVDLSKAPFASQRLLYHLYDYNRYVDDDDPVEDPFDDQLYCRALDTPYDPTFKGASSSSKCRERGQRCLYSYAQVFDQGLYVDSRPLGPEEVQFAFNETGLYANETPKDRTRKCLADNGNDLYSLGTTFAVPRAEIQGPIAFIIDGKNYEYRGPYRAVGPTQWEITGDAVSGADGDGNYWGLFERLAHSSDVGSGLYSLKFPRAGRLRVRRGVQYIGQDTTPKVTSHPDRGFDLPSGDLEKSLLMDGCNLRVARFNETSREGLESCDVTAIIELVKRDDETGEFSLFEGVSSKRLKLQLVRKTGDVPLKKPLKEKDLLSTDFQTCRTNSACGKDECCYNKRCWSRSIVTQCLDDTFSSPLPNGKACTSDMECQGLCCSPVTGTCQAHDGKENLCSKPLGATCIADEFCAKVTQTVYKKIKTGLDPSTGKMTCKWHPFNTFVYADCIKSGTQGICRVPPNVESGEVDPAKIDCSDAEDPPTTSGGL